MKVNIKIDPEISNNKRVVFWDGEFSHHINESELQQVLTEAKKNWWKSDEKNGAKIGSQLYHFLNGSGGKLQTALKESYHRGIPLHIYLDIPFELDALPFELLCKEQFLLLNSQTHLIRQVNDRNSLKIETPEKRMLKVLFMACSPLNLAANTLQYEKEEEWLLQAVEQLPMDMVTEDLGSLEGLKNKLIEAAGYEVVHISGHAGIEPRLGSVFYMENDIGELDRVTPHQLWEVFKLFPPKLLFLSGCSTGKRDELNASESFAHIMVEQGVSFVLGWGLPVSDYGAIQFTIKLYEYLAMGKGIHEAVQEARLFVEQKYHPWPLLRLFSDGSNLAPLIAPGQPLRVKTTRKTTYKYLQDSQVRVLEYGFVGRRREVQAGIRTIKGFEDKCGLLIRGPAGVGKSCLAGKLIERFPEKELIVIHGRLRAVDLLAKLRKMFDRKGITSGMDIIKSEQELEEKIKALFRTPLSEQPTMIYLDDFEKKGRGLVIRRRRYNALQRKYLC